MGMNTVQAYRARRKDQADRRRRRHLAAAVLVLVVTVLAVAALALVGVAAAVVVDNLNRPQQCNGLRSALSAESVRFAVKPCYLLVPFLTRNPACI